MHLSGTPRRVGRVSPCRLRLVEMNHHTDPVCAPLVQCELE